MNLNSDILEIIIKGGTRIIPNNTIYEVNPYNEWVKWLSYVPNFDIKEMKEQEKMLKLFKKYGTSNITENEYLKVYDYMKNESITDLMKSKLTKEELLYAKEKIKYYSNVPKEELSNKVKIERQDKNYQKLSMVDSYILHELLEISHYRNMKKLRIKSESSSNNNANMNQKSLYYASNLNKNKN